MDSEENIYRDRQLFAAIAQNDIDAFTRFFHLHKQRIIEVAYKMTRTKEISEELSQEFFLKLWDKREGLDKVDNPAAYIYMSVYYMAVNHLRRRGNEARILELKRMTEKDYNDDTRQRIDERQLRKQIAEASVQLPEVQRKVFELRYQEQISYEDISTMLGITKGTAQSYFHLAIKTIRETLDKHRSDIGMLALAFMLYDYL